MTNSNPINDAPITNWEEFRQQIHDSNRKLLARLDNFPNAVLVTGCQRSGTTMLSRIITQSEGMVNYYFGADDELDAALILSGYVNHQSHGRYCFQTTYLDEHYNEYFEHDNDHKILWVLRNPYSTVYSLLYNWPSRSLQLTFRSLVVSSFNGLDKWTCRLLGTKRFSKVQQACMVYNKKVSQLFELRLRLGTSRFFIVDYDELVLNKEIILPEMYQFIKLAYKQAYASKIHAKSLNKLNDLSADEFETIKLLCESHYLKAKTLCSYLDNLTTDSSIDDREKCRG